MESLMELVKKLKSSLLTADSNDYTSNQWITPLEIHQIRKGLADTISNSNRNLELSFLNHCYDFRSVYEFFFYDEYPHEAINYITSMFDPVLIELMENDYEINIRKISITDNISQIYPNLISNINAMEKAYHDLEYERVTTLSSTILQSVFKEICDLNDITYEKNAKFPQLYKKVKSVLKLDAKDYTHNASLRDFCSSINSIVVKLNELRNIYSESHGVSQTEVFHYEKLKKHHIKLIVDSTKTIVNFLIDSYDYQYNSLNI